MPKEHEPPPVENGENDGPRPTTNAAPSSVMSEERREEPTVISAPPPSQEGRSNSPPPQYPASPVPPAPSNAEFVVPQGATLYAVSLHDVELPQPCHYATGVLIPPPPVDERDAPPAYDTLGMLPTYEEAEAMKQNGGVQPGVVPQPPRPMTVVEGGQGRGPRTPVTRDEERDMLLGTDFIFLAAFFIAFVFSWVGFLLLICCCRTIAGRYGALAGFGLSLAKLTMIIHHRNTIEPLKDPGNIWLWWLLILFGVLIFIRATFQYFRIKRDWDRLPRVGQERLFFFH